MPQANQDPVRSSNIDYKVNLYILIFVKLASQNIYFFLQLTLGKSLNNLQSLVLFGFMLTAFSVNSWPKGAMKSKGEITP